MPEVDEFGIPIKKSHLEVDDFGIPIKKKITGAGSGGGSGTSAIGLPSSQSFPVNGNNKPSAAPQILTPKGEKEYKDIQAKRSISPLERAMSAYNAAQGDSAMEDIQKQAENKLPDQVSAPGDRKGNRAGFVYNQLLRGIGSLASAVNESAIILGQSIPGAKQEGDLSLDYYRENVAPGTREALVESIGADVDAGRERKYQGEFVTSAIGGLAQSVPAIVAGPLRTPALFLQAYDGAIQSVEAADPQDKISEEAKTIYGIGVGSVVSALEKFGLDRIFKDASPAVARGVVNKAIKTAVEAEEKITGDALTRFLNAEVKDLTNQYSKVGAKAADSFLAEAGTGGAQEGATIGAENLLNKATGESVFDTSDITTWEGFAKTAERIGYAAAQEGVGGGILGTGVGVLSRQRDSKIKQQQTLISSIDEQIDNPETPEPVKEVLIQQKIKIQEKLDTELEKEQELQSKLTLEQVKQAQDLQDQVAKVEATIADPNVPEELKESLKEQLDNLNKEIKETIKPKKGVESAVQEQIATPMDVGELSQDGSGMGEGNQVQEPSGETLPQEVQGDQLQEEEIIQPTNEKETTTDSQGFEPVTGTTEEGTGDQAGGGENIPAEGAVPESSLAKQEGSALKNANIAEKRKELGLEPREAVERKANPDLVKAAKKAIAAGEFDAGKTIDKILVGKKELTDEEAVSLKLYQLAKEDEILAVNEQITKSIQEGRVSDTDTLIAKRDIATKEILSAFEAGEKSGTVSARALQSRKINLINDFSLAGMLTRKHSSAGGEALSSEAIAKVQQDYAKIKELNEKLEAKVRDLEVKNVDILSDKAFKKIKSDVELEKRKYGRVVEREAIDKNITDTLADLKKKLKEQRSTLSANPIPVQFIPDIIKLSKLYAQKGVNTLEDVIDNIYTNLKDDIQGLNKADIKALIADYDFEGEANEEKRLQNYKTRTRKQLIETDDKRNRRDFSKKKIIPVKYDEEALELRDALRKAKHDFQTELEKDKLRQRTKAQKFIDDINNVKGLVKSLKATWDLSAPFRQGIVALINHPVTGMEAMAQMHKNAFSIKAYERWRNDLEDSPLYNLMQDAGLDLTNTQSPNILAKEEDFSSNLAEKIPVLGRLTKGSERGYVTFLNYMRAHIFMDAANELASDGITFESHPEEYKSIARVINNETGRGGLGRAERAADLAGLLLWSPRLLMSRINTFTSIFDPSYTPRARKKAALDLARFIGVAGSVMFLASVIDEDDEDIEWNPLSTNFGKYKRGDVRYSIIGGYEAYITLMSRILTGKTKTGKGIVKDMDKTAFGGKSRWDYLGTFARGKAAPDLGILVNLMDGKDVVGNTYKLWDVPDEVLPLVLPEVIEAYRAGGAVEVMRVLPFTTYGVTVSRYSDRGKKQRKPGVFEELYNAAEQRIEELNKEKK